MLTGSSLHQKIISVGKDPMIEENKIPQTSPSSASIHSDLYSTHQKSREEEAELEEKRAFTFSIVQRFTKGTRLKRF